jgi:hypothetical protein
MTPATAELQRRSFEIAMDATRKALAQPRAEEREISWGGEIPAEKEWPDPPLPKPDRREDDEPFSCLTCEDRREIEVQQRNSAGQAFREPWLTRTIPCPDCINPDGAR